MKIKHTQNGIEYILSNEDLVVGDKVYPISCGKVVDGKYVHYDFDFTEACSGFPNAPHTIMNLHHSPNSPKDKVYEVRTDKGYSPVECYFKIKFEIVKSEDTIDNTIILKDIDIEAQAKLIETQAKLIEELEAKIKRMRNCDNCRGGCGEPNANINYDCWRGE